ncbi:MAG: guanylate kinase [Planctomycetes bacterium]|nr:guanylate kinase [Planctomycetota bacterium]
MAVEFPSLPGRQVFVVMSGPSGAGKSTLLECFLAGNPDFRKSLSTTTRPPRIGERHGIDYDFVSTDEFQRRVDEGLFIEHFQVFAKHWYGTPRFFIEDCFAKKLSVIKDLDVQGAAQIRGNVPSALLVYVVPPSADEIERRLRTRSSDSADSITRRLRAVGDELAHWRSYDYLVINDDLDRATSDLEAIVRSHRLKIGRRD